ncbi:MAG: IS1380 family transposase [bacterium]
MVRKIRPVNLQVEFGNDTVTQFGNFHTIETFKQAIDLTGIIKNNFTLSKPINSLYSAPQTLEHLIDCCCLGLSRFEHTETLRFDPGYLDLKQISSFPSEKVFRNLLSAFQQTHIQELININKKLNHLKSKWSGHTHVTLDFDDSVVTLHGHQEGGEVGYNPRYHGRPSFKVKVCFIGSSNELLHFNLYSGKVHSNGDFLPFFQTCLDLLPPNYVATKLRLDKGFFDEDNLIKFEELYLEYVCKAPLRENLRKLIISIPEKDWKEIDEYTSITSKEFLLKTWKKPRRFVIRRVKIDKDTSQLLLDYKDFYRYEAVVTNMEGDPAEIMNFYDDRANVENKIDELKDGFAVEEASQHLKIRNQAFMFIKVIAYNLMNWYRQALLPEDKKNCEIKTIRRQIINIPGNILGKGRFHRIKLAANKLLESIIQIIKTNLDAFFYFVANGFTPVRC